MGDFYLMDLERTIALGKPYFWKKNKHGYTNEIRFAGLFSKKLAEEIVKHDIENKTVMIHHVLIDETLLLDLKNNEAY